MNPVRLSALAGLALCGLACGRVEIEPLAGGNGQGGAPSAGGHTSAGMGGSSSAGGSLGAGGTGVGGASGGGATGLGGTIGAGGATATVPCNKLGDERTCTAHGCRADYCPACPASRFVSCASPSDPMRACGPVPPCFTIDCPAAKSLVDCEGLFTDCHPVFAPVPATGMCVDPTTCGAYERCAYGAFTGCVQMPQPPLCGMAPPSCAPGYLPTLSGACYDGECVSSEDCELPPLP